MTLLTTTTVFTGTAPNDGTGDDIRQAFNQVNYNFSNITTFLNNGPSLSNVVVEGVLTADTGMFVHNVDILSTAISTIPTNGALVVVGGTGISGNLNVGGTISGTITSSSITAANLSVTSTLLTFGDAVFAGNSTGITGNLTVEKDVQIIGSLTVLGDVRTVTTSEFLIEHPTIELGRANVLLGGNAALSYNDGRDRGIEFFWFDTVGNTQQEGFFGFDNSSEKFTFIPKSTYVGSGDTDIFAGAPGTAVFGTVEANVSSTGNSVFNTVNANVITVSSGIAGNLTTAAQPNVTSVGTLTGLDVASGNINVTDGDVYVTNGTVKVLVGNTYVPVAVGTGIWNGGPVGSPTQFLSNIASIDTITGAVTIAGGLGVAGNVNIGGNFSSNGFTANILGGTLTTSAQPNITSVGTLSSLAVTANISASTLSITNVSASGTIAASSISASTGISGTLTTAAQPNITSVGTLASLNVTGNVSANYFNGIFNGAVSGNITGSAETVTANAQPAITSVGTLTSLDVAGNITSANINAGSGTIQTTGNISTTGNVISTFLYGTLKTVAQPFVTSVGTLGSLTVSGNTLAIGTTTIGTGLAASSSLVNIGSSANRFGTIYAAAINNSGITTTGSISSSGNVQILTAGTGIIFSDGSFQSTATTAKASTLAQGGGSGPAMTFNWSAQLGQPTGLWGSNDGITTNTYNPSNFSVTYATTAGTVTDQTNSATITATSANIAGNIVLRDANGDFSAGTITAISTSARYADLAEMYQSDGQYDPGTVLVFGGTREVTVTGHQADVSVAGVASTNPAYLMNKDEPNAIAVALRGKVPVKVMGPVKKGDLLVTSYISGHAMSVGRDTTYGVAVFAKSLVDDLTDGAKLINAVIL